jgi:hypothetical protein
MTATQLVSLQGAPGRLGEVLDHMSAAKRIHTSLGARVRGWQVIVGGPASLQLAYTLEFDDMAAFGIFSAKSLASQEWQQFQQTILGSPAPSATVLGITLSSSIPGVEDSTTPAPKGNGPRVRSVRQQVVTQGRDQDAIANFQAVKPILKSLGARFFARRVAVAGINSTNRLVSGTEFDDIAAYGRFAVAAATNKALTQFLATKVNIAAPATVVASLVLVQELPI